LYFTLRLSILNNKVAALRTSSGKGRAKPVTNVVERSLRRQKPMAATGERASYTL